MTIFSSQRWRLLPLPALLLVLLLAACAPLRGTGDLGLVIERASGRVLVVETTGQTRLHQIEGLGDLSHASIVYSRDARYGYVFGRDGGLTKVDALTGEIVKRVIQSGNSIGGAISQSGRLVAVSNYTPGGVKIFDSGTLELVAEIPAIGASGERSKVVGLVDAPGETFVFTLFDAGEIWIADMSSGKPQLRKYVDIGDKPYDALISGDGRYYIAGLFGEDGLALLDLWNPDQGVKRILDGYGRGVEKLPVYKMPHLEGWAMASGKAFLPAVGRHEVLVVETSGWTEVARIPVHGQPIFVMARPDQRQVWVNFAYPKNGVVQVIDLQKMAVVKSIDAGKGVMHMEFTPRGERIWVSVRDRNAIKIYDTESFEEIKSLPAEKPSGIFFTNRAHRIGL